MKTFHKLNLVGSIVAAAVSVGTAGAGATDVVDVGVPTPVEAIIASISDQRLVDLLNDVLERNPDLAAQRALLEAAWHRAPQERSLPQPRADVTAYLLPPETRVGPQRWSARISQAIPGSGKRKLRREVAHSEVAGAAARLAAQELRLVTQARRLFYEIAFLDASRSVIRTDRATLDHFEALARSRYSSGVGLQKDVIQIQAEITRLDARLADLAAQRASKVATLNLLRDRAGGSIEKPTFPLGFPPLPAWDDIRATAMARRPELTAVEARISRSENLKKLASKNGSPDFNVGLTYAFVQPRSDTDPPDNGQDIFGISGGITVPVWRKGINSGVEEATQRILADQAERRAWIAKIEHEIEDLRGRIPEIQRQLGLFRGVLLVQSEQALKSAEAAYVAGRVGGLALLEAERVLLDVRLAAERAWTDLAIAHATLEGAIASPIEWDNENEDT